MGWQRNRTNHGTGGFSLVELLVVVAIIVVLLALLLPGVRSMKGKAVTTSCRAQLSQWGVFWSTYLSDHDGSYSDGVRVENGRVVGWRRGEWASVLRPYYMSAVETLRCPKAVDPTIINGKLKFYGGVNTTYNHGGVGGVATADRSSYGINCWVYNPPPPVVSIQRRESVKHWRRPSGAKKPSRVPLMLDSMWRGGGPDYDARYAIRTPNYNGQWLSYDKEMMHFALDRHEGGVNAVMMDGSARHVPIKTLWTFRWHNRYRPRTGLAQVQGTWPAWMADYPEPDPPRKF